jgi:hypothetical protein
MKNFDEWYRIRANLPKNESILAAGLGAGALAAGKWAWDKYKNWRNPQGQLDKMRQQNDPRNPKNLMKIGGYNNLIDPNKNPDLNWWERVEGFARNLGITKPVANDSDPLWSALSRVAASRIYGKTMGHIDRPQLSIIWNAIAKKGKVARPFDIPAMVPGAEATPEMKTYWTQQAIAYDKEIVSALHNAKVTKTDPNMKQPGQTANSTGAQPVANTTSKVDKKRRRDLYLNSQTSSGQTVWELVKQITGSSFNGIPKLGIITNLIQDAINKLPNNKKRTKADLKYVLDQLNRL